MGARLKNMAQMGLFMILATVVLAAGVRAQSMSADHSDKNKENSAPVRLFDTIEYRSTLRVFPQWTRVLSVVNKQIMEYTSCDKSACSPAAKSWQHIMKLAKNKSPMEKLTIVNAFFNQWPYRLDIEVYGKSDYWASPNEFLRLSGDCEDYSIIKYFALKQIGFSSEKMRIVIVKDRIRNIGHAVLAVYINDTAFTLDNLSDLVLPHNKYQHYTPQYSVNETSRWAHIRPIGKQGF